MKYLQLILLFLYPLSLNAADGSDIDKIDKSSAEYTQLKTAIENGAFNSQIFKKIAEVSPTPEIKLAYLRQAYVLFPTDQNISSQIATTKENLNKNNLAKSFMPKGDLLEIVSPRSYLPFYVLDYILISLSVLLFVFAVKKIKDIKFYLTLVLFLFFLFDKVVVTYTRSGHLRLINSKYDIFKSEGIILDSLKTYSSQETTSQVTYVLKPGDEVDIDSINPKIGAWIKVKFDNGRSGWLQYQPESLFVIRR